MDVHPAISLTSIYEHDEHALCLKIYIYTKKYLYIIYSIYQTHVHSITHRHQLLLWFKPAQNFHATEMTQEKGLQQKNSSFA